MFLFQIVALLNNRCKIPQPCVIDMFPQAQPISKESGRSRNPPSTGQLAKCFLEVWVPLFVKMRLALTRLANLSLGNGVWYRGSRKHQSLPTVQTIADGNLPQRPLPLSKAGNLGVDASYLHGNFLNPIGNLAKMNGGVFAGPMRDRGV